jgi:hypothetical protein
MHATTLHEKVPPPRPPPPPTTFGYWIDASNTCNKNDDIIIIIIIIIINIIILGWLRHKQATNPTNANFVLQLYSPIVHKSRWLTKSRVLVTTNIVSILFGRLLLLLLRIPSRRRRRRRVLSYGLNPKS